MNAPGRPRAKDIGSWLMLNALWTPLTFQDTALMTIAVPAASLQLAPAHHVLVLALFVSIAGAAAMVVPPVAGWFSDVLRRRGGSRRAFAAVGIAIDVVALLALSRADTLLSFASCLVVATAGANVALCAYQALLPESVPRQHWGVVSGVRGAATLLGTVLGFAVAGSLPNFHDTFFAAAAIIALGGLSLFAVGEGVYDNEEHAEVRDWHDFLVVFAARMLVFFGLILLQTYVLLFFRDVLHLTNPSAGTALYGVSAIVGALGSSICLGILSDRVPRKIVTALAGVPMAIAVIGFALAPRLDFMLPFATLFGIGFGGVISSGWALAMDTIPELRDVARDLGLWGIATNLPNVVAPLVGGWIISSFGGTRAGFQAVFGLAGFSFALASLAVLRVGRRPLSSLWEWPLRFGAIVTNFAWVHVVYRVRGWGRLPRKRGASLVVANHQHDLESMALVSTMTVQSGPWRHPIFTASSRRMYEPGFMALRLPWLRGLLRSVNAGPLFVAIGMLPLENELGSREISALAWTLQQRHGVIPLTQLFDDRVASLFAPGTSTNDLLGAALFDKSHTVVKVAALREPYRREVLDDTRASIERDLARMEAVVRNGGTFYLTPEGRYSLDGRIGPMRGAIDRLAPRATIYLAGVSYDPFVSKRLSMLYRLVPFERAGAFDEREKARLVKVLAGIRPVTASHVLAAWLLDRTEPFTDAQARTGAGERLRTLPPQLFVDPEFARRPDRMVRKALSHMLALGILERGGAQTADAAAQSATYVLSAVRRHPQFPLVTDIVAFQATVFFETVANAAYSTPML